MPPKTKPESTYIFIENMYGNQINIQCGYRSPDELMEITKNALEIHKQSRAHLPPRQQDSTQAGPSTSTPVPPSGSSTSTSLPPPQETPGTRKNPIRQKKNIQLTTILPTPQDTPEAPVESSSKKTDTQGDPDYQFVDTQGLDD
jgi:hypothetical protein